MVSGLVARVLRWRERATAVARETASVMPATVAPAPPAQPDPPRRTDWVRVPPLRSVNHPDRSGATRTVRFAERLQRINAPSRSLAPLAHEHRRDAPSGFVSGLAEPTSTTVVARSDRPTMPVLRASDPTVDAAVELGAPRPRVDPWSGEQPGRPVAGAVTSRPSVDGATRATIGARGGTAADARSTPVVARPRAAPATTDHGGRPPVEGHPTSTPAASHLPATSVRPVPVVARASPGPTGVDRIPGADGGHRPDGRDGVLSRGPLVRLPRRRLAIHGQRGPAAASTGPDTTPPVATPRPSATTGPVPTRAVARSASDDREGRPAGRDRVARRPLVGDRAADGRSGAADGVAGAGVDTADGLARPIESTPDPVVHGRGHRSGAPDATRQPPPGQQTDGAGRHGAPVPPATSVLRTAAPTPRPGVGAPVARVPDSARPLVGGRGAVEPTRPAVVVAGREAAVRAGMDRLLATAAPRPGPAATTADPFAVPSVPEAARPTGPVAVARRLDGDAGRATTGPQRPLVGSRTPALRAVDPTAAAPVPSVAPPPVPARPATDAVTDGAADGPHPTRHRPHAGSSAVAQRAATTTGGPRTPGDPTPDLAPDLAPGRATGRRVAVAPSRRSLPAVTDPLVGAGGHHAARPALPVVAVARTPAPAGPLGGDGGTVAQRDPRSASVATTHAATPPVGRDDDPATSPRAATRVAEPDDGASPGDEDVQALVRRLYPRLRDELRWDLRAQRERAGLLGDPL